MKTTPLGNFLLKILKFRGKKLKLFCKTGSTADTVKIIDMNTGGEDRSKDEKWMPLDQKYRPKL